MTLYLTNRDGNGKTDEQGHYKFQTNVWSGSVLGVNSLKVTQNSPTGMSVLVGTGDFKIDTTDAYSYTGWNSTSAPVTITTADLANPRITSIVIYVDKSAPTSPSPPNNPGIVKLMAVNGSPGAVPTPPTGSAIQTAVGAGNPYIILANVTVPANATQIVNANISDQRVLITLGADLVGTAALLDSSVTNAKLANNSVGTANIINSATTTAKMANAAITTAKFSPSTVATVFTPAGARWAQGGTNIWQNVTNCSFVYNVGPTNETLLLWLTTMAFKDTGGEGAIRLAVDGVGQTEEMYYNPGTGAIWVRACQNYAINVNANTSVTISVQSKNVSGGTFSITNEQAKWMPKVTGFSVYRP